MAAGIFAGEALILMAVAFLSNHSDGLGGGRLAIPILCALVATLLYATAGVLGPRPLKAATCSAPSWCPCTR